MTQFTLGASVIGEATKWGAHRIRTVLNVPYTLNFAKAPSGAKGGARKKLFRLSDVLERCWRVRTFNEQLAQALIDADQLARKSNMETKT